MPRTKFGFSGIREEIGKYIRAGVPDHTYYMNISTYGHPDGGGILHCYRDGGVVFQNLQSLHLCGWQIHSYYRVKKYRSGLTNKTLRFG